MCEMKKDKYFVVKVMRKGIDFIRAYENGDNPLKSGLEYYVLRDGDVIKNLKFERRKDEDKKTKI